MREFTVGFESEMAHPPDRKCHATYAFSNPTGLVPMIAMQVKFCDSSAVCSFKH
jgi:hypothetical protein